MSELTHKPVMLREVLEGLAIRPEGVYVDGTFGRGGHSLAILERLGAEGRLFALDKDWSAIEWGRRTITDPRLTLVQGSFTQLKELAVAHHIDGRVDGILLDLGVSSPQLDDPARGFSFLRDGPLDMRMDTQKGISAAAWLSEVDEKELAGVLFEYGEERHSRRIAKAIVSTRQEKPITTTSHLASIIAQANPSREIGKHKATRSFQGIRIFINQELQDIKDVLPQAVDVLAVGGRLAVISFHSLEDRIVKRFIRTEAKGDDLPADLPIKASSIQPRIRIVAKAMYAQDDEVVTNPRSRSARLRIAEKIA